MNVQEAMARLLLKVEVPPHSTADDIKAATVDCMLAAFDAGVEAALSEALVAPPTITRFEGDTIGQARAEIAALMPPGTTAAI